MYAHVKHFHSNVIQMTIKQQSKRKRRRMSSEIFALIFLNYFLNQNSKDIYFYLFFPRFFFLFNRFCRFFCDIDASLIERNCKPITLERV